jgi:hypothetical protein
MSSEPPRGTTAIDEGLAMSSLASSVQRLHGLKEGPARFPVVFRDVRRAILRRFPFGTFSSSMRRMRQ